MWTVFTQTWHRNILEHMLETHAHMMHGKVIDIGSERRRYDYLFDADIDAVDIVPNKEKNVRFGDIEKGIDVADNVYDGAICTEVLEYLDSPDQAIEEIARVIKSGGVALVSVPAMYPDHKDNMHFTKRFLEKKFQEHFSIVTVSKMGSKYTVLWDVLRLAICRSKFKHLGPVMYLFLVPLLPYYALVRLFGGHKVQDEFYSGLFVVAKK